MFFHSPVFVSASRVQRFVREYRGGVHLSWIAITNGVHPEIPRVITEASNEFDDFDERVDADGGITVAFEDCSARFDPIAKAIEFTPSSTPAPRKMSI